MRLGTILVGALIVTLAAQPTRADVLFGVQAGAGYLRLGDLEDFWDDVGLAHHTDDLAFQWEISGTWRFVPRHAVRLSVERITSSVALFDVAYFAPLPPAILYSDQHFETIPISLGYEFTARRSDHGALTLIGAGGGLYLTEIEGDVATYYDDPLVSSIEHGSRSANGYGFHGYLRQTAPISERLAISGMLRGRRADAMAFEDDEGAVPVDFTDFDFSVGLEWRI